MHVSPKYVYIPVQKMHVSLSVCVVPQYHLLALLHIDAQRLLHKHVMTARVTQHVQQDVDMCHVGSGHDDDVTHAGVQQGLVVSKHLKEGEGEGERVGWLSDMREGVMLS